MKRYFIRDVARNFRSPLRARYMIAVVRKLGGIIPRECNCCGFHGLFHAADHPPMYDEMCPKCGSRPRHRLVALLLQRRPELGAAGRVIHFAPESERELAKILEQRSSRYRSADIAAGDSDLRLDIEAIALPDKSIDLFVINHVLEHVADDRRALAELFRCLAPGGSALITVPVMEGWPVTYESDNFAGGGSADERLLHFGNAEHVRQYGADVRQRITAAGFALEEFQAGPEDVLQYGLERGETVFIARKK
jgi:SAM-dependent methyltransferase